MPRNKHCRWAGKDYRNSVFAALKKSRLEGAVDNKELWAVAGTIVTEVLKLSDEDAEQVAAKTGDELAAQYSSKSEATAAMRGEVVTRDEYLELLSGIARADAKEILPEQRARVLDLLAKAEGWHAKAGSDDRTINITMTLYTEEMPPNMTATGFVRDSEWGIDDSPSLSS